MAPVEEKSMVPTVLVGIGGTGAEILSRVRRLAEETYGSLKNFPIISFLWVDTDKDYKITNPEGAGSPFKDNEKHWARVAGREVEEIISNMENYPWIRSWFPNELERNITSLEAGAGQIRACGRFAFFCNYHAIRDTFLGAMQRIKAKENFMLDRYNIKVSTNAINVFVTGSLSGGTGSGMLIDMGYCIRNWLKGEGSPLVTAVVPMPNAFAGIKVGDRVLSNGYAAMMELSYFSDGRTQYEAQYSRNLADEVRSRKAPFDFTYLVGTKNGENDFRLEQIREAIAQNIFLDLTSDFSPHKRSIRDNIKGAWAEKDPGGRGYPKNFMSFGLSTIEIPIAQIRASLANRLAKDLVGWWLNESVQLPPDMLALVRGDMLQKMRLTEAELLADISSAGDRPYLAEISKFINSIRNEVANDNLLQCTQQGVNMVGTEKGKILQFVDNYLKPKTDAYVQDHFRELGPDERSHGDYLKRMYDNRNKIIQNGRKVLEAELYQILEDRTKGPKFAEDFLVTVRRIFEDAREKFRRERDKVWVPNENNRRQQHEAALADINEFKDKFGISKQAKMEEYCESALSGLEGSLIAIVQRKSRALGLEVLNRLQEHLTELERRLNRWNQRAIRMRDFFQEQADRQAESADALLINGIKLYDRQELNGLYQDAIEQLAGASESSKSRYELGMDGICSTASEDVLKQASPLWKENRAVDEVMRLFDVTEIPDVREEDAREIIFDRTYQVLANAPETSKLKQELAACDRIFKAFNDDAEIVNNIRIAYNKSKPLIQLSPAVMSGQDAGFTPALNANVALIGGRNTVDPAAQKMIPKLQEFIGSEDDIKPLGELEHHRIVFVQEIGGFSLRCIDGMRELQKSYQDWKGGFIEAKRAQLRGESRDLPIPVHMQKEAPFWDLFPEDPSTFELIVQARAMAILRCDRNLKTQESVIRYERQTKIGPENVDIASSWEEAIQALEIAACRRDREEIQQQVAKKLNGAETEAQKQNLYEELMAYLNERSVELEKDGGKDSPDYKREATVLLATIEQYQLVTSDRTDVAPPPEYMRADLVEELPALPERAIASEPPVVEAPAASASDSSASPRKDFVFCTECGTKNPLGAKFCFECGTKLVK